MSNLSEEEIVTLQELQYALDNIGAFDFGDFQVETIRSVLDLYNKEKEKNKKIKELSEGIVNKFEKQGEIISKLARAIMFMGTNPDITEEEVIKAFTENPITEEFLDKFRKEYISKDKIRGKIKKLEDMKIITRELYGKTMNEQIYKFAQTTLNELLENIRE